MQTNKIEKVVKFEIKPIEAILFRTSTPFDFGATAFNVAPDAPPSTIVGALRGLFISLAKGGIGRSIPKEKIDEPMPREWRFLGTVIAEKTGNGMKLFYPTPVDLVLKEIGRGGEKYVTTVSFIGNVTSFPSFFLRDIQFEELISPVPLVKVEDGASKKESYYIGGYLEKPYVSEDFIRDYLLGEININKPKIFKEIKNCKGSWDAFREVFRDTTDFGKTYMEPKVRLEKDTKVVKIDESTGKGGYYNVQFYKFKRDKSRESYYIAFLLPLNEKQISLPGEFTIRLGGEGKLARISDISNQHTLIDEIFSQTEFFEKLVEEIVEEKKIKIYALTPIILLHADKTTSVPPMKLVIKLGASEITLVLRAYMIKREVEVSGWSLKDGGFKRTLKAVSPGSIFYYEVKEDLDKATAKELVFSLLFEGFPPSGNLDDEDYKSVKMFFETHLKNIYNSVLVGTWRFNL